ncbi:MAG TPA: metal-dependent phosphohydrolase [Chloroflexota bacterium]
MGYDSGALIDGILERFRLRGNTAYIGEPVSVAEHMLQAADAAERDGAGAALVAAALLHDYGHLLHDLPEGAADHGVDTRHEDLTYAYLSRYFIGAVVEPIRMHVAAKRYLCAVDPGYLAGLSPASMLSLELQGGPFSREEIESFEQSMYAQDAVRLRRYDDVAKIVGAVTPDLEHYRPVLERVLA